MEEKIKEIINLLEKYLEKIPSSKDEQAFEIGSFQPNDILDKFYIPLCVLTWSLENPTLFSIPGLGWVYQHYKEMSGGMPQLVKDFIKENSVDVNLPDVIRMYLKSMLEKLEENANG